MRRGKRISKKLLILEVCGSQSPRAVQQEISCGNSQAAASGKEPIRVDGLGNGESSRSAARIRGTTSPRSVHAHGAKVHFSAIDKRAMLEIEAKRPTAGEAVGTQVLVPNRGDRRNTGVGKVTKGTENGKGMRVRVASLSAAIRADIDTLKILRHCRAKRRQNKSKYTDSSQESVQITPHLID
jgi:hypothetical protein